MHHRSIVRSFPDPGIRLLVSLLLIYLYCVSALFISSGTIWGEAKRIARVVVVDVAARVDIPRIIRVATIRAAQPHILALAYTPYVFTSRNGFYLIPATFLFLREYLLYFYPNI